MISMDLVLLGELHACYLSSSPQLIISNSSRYLSVDPLITRGVYDAILSIIQLFGDSMHYDGHVQARCKVASNHSFFSFFAWILITYF